MTTEDALPALPEPTIKPYYPPAGLQHYPPATVQSTVEVAFPQAWYTAEQMRAYALAALTLVQAERDAALVDAESWRQQADSRTADAVMFGAQTDAMQQERDELRAALRELVSFRDDACKGAGEDFSRGQRVWQEARATLAPKATQPTSEASRGR